MQYNVSVVYILFVARVHMVLWKGIKNNLYMEKYLLYRRSDLIISSTNLKAFLSPSKF
jgi:hypothetical protein